jgi:hypothetical protein
LRKLVKKKTNAYPAQSAEECECGVLQKACMLCRLKSRMRLRRRRQAAQRHALTSRKEKSPLESRKYTANTKVRNPPHMTTFLTFFCNVVFTTLHTTYNATDDDITY